MNDSQKHHDLVFRSDKLRKGFDIRYKPRSKLSWYQKNQLRHIRRYTEDLQTLELGKKIRAIFEFWESEPSFPLQSFSLPLLEESIDQSIDQLINHHHHHHHHHHPSSKPEIVFP